MDRADKIPKFTTIVEGDTIRVSNPNRKGGFVSFEIKGLTDEARLRLRTIERPARTDLRALGVTLHLIPDPETSALAEKRGFSIENEDIKINLDISEPLYRRM